MPLYLSKNSKKRTFSLGLLIVVLIVSFVECPFSSIGVLIFLSIGVVPKKGTTQIETSPEKGYTPVPKKGTTTSSEKGYSSKDTIKTTYNKPSEKILFFEFFERYKGIY